MQITDIGLLGPGFERRLRAALDAVAPPTLLISNARYRSTRSSRPWRLASALVGIGAVGAVAVSAFAATGSPNPAVWTERAASSIQSVTHIPETSPNPPQSPIPDPRLNAPISQPTGTSHATSSDNPQPSHDAEESPPPDESLRPKGSPPPEAQKPSPSDSPDHHPEHDSKPSPPPHDQGGDSHGQ